MNNDEIKNTLEFINKAIQCKEEEHKNLFDFTHRFAELHRKVQAKLPYHINVIDELNANENAHSRILTKLLQYKTENNRFEILEGFINYLKEQKVGTFSNVKTENPIVTQETERIDLWVRDKDYAIIIENKIHNAPDQEQQLKRYIEKTKKHGFTNEKIFVVYLSSQNEEPKEQSWGKYKDEFQERYLNLSFNNDILKWLKEKTLPNVKLKDIFLRSAIEQYIDHLEGIYDLRTINKKMNMELKDFLKKELGLDGANVESIAKLFKKRDDLNHVTHHINLLIEELTNETDKLYFTEWQKYISETYPNFENVNEKSTRAGLIFPIDNQTSVRISISYDGKLYCQMDMDIFENQNLPENIEEKIRHLLTLKNNNNQIWKYFDRYDYDGVFKCFQKVMEILAQK